MRLKDGFAAGTHVGTFLEYPIDKDGKRMWPGMYPDMAAIDKQRKRIGNRVAWNVYCLRIISNDEQIITKGMITTYDMIPTPPRNEHPRIRSWRRPGDSQRDTADYTAIITLLICGYGAQRKDWIHHQGLLIFEWSSPQTIDTIPAIDGKLGSPTFYVESVAYQESAVQTLRRTA